MNREWRRAEFCEDGQHQLSVVGYLRRRHDVPGLDCERPLRAVCRRCDYWTAWRCSGHRESRCRPCASRYRRRVGAVAFSGTQREGGYLYRLTLTAPGAREHCKRPGCEGAPLCGHELCPCTGPGGTDLARWNPGAARCWNRFRTALRRSHPGVEYFRGAEVQEGKRRADGVGRGALHSECVVWSPSALEVSEVRAMAMAAGFGHSLRLTLLTGGRQAKDAARYAAKYVTKAADVRAAVPWWGETVDITTGEIIEGLVDATYRTWSMSRNWGLTMAAVRADALVFAKERQAAMLDEALALVMRELGGLVIADDGQAAESPPAPS